MDDMVLDRDWNELLDSQYQTLKTRTRGTLAHDSEPETACQRVIDTELESELKWALSRVEFGGLLNSTTIIVI